MSDYPPHLAQMREEALRTTVEAWAIRARLPLSRGVERVGPCPVCGGKDRFAVNTRKNAWNCLGCDKGGKDSISLAMHIHGVDFVGALEMITGRSAKDAKNESATEKAVREDQMAALRQKADADKMRRDREADRYRQRARKQGYEIWQRATSWIPAGPVHAYLLARGVELPEWWPIFIRLRESVAHPYVLKVDGVWQKIHTGPAMITCVQRASGVFGAVHQTWLGEGGDKASFIHPVTGEKLPAKKVLGAKKGGAIQLYTPSNARRLVAGEGVETTLSVMMAEQAADTAYWCLVDLGNMAGRAARDADNKILADQPDLGDTAAFVPPDWVEEMVFLGDADAKTDKDLAKTHAALVRGCRRAMALRPGLKTSIAMAERGKDFNDMARVETL